MFHFDSHKTSHNGDDAAFANSLPRQPEHQRIELGAAQAGLHGCAGSVGSRPDEVALMQTPGRQPDTNTVMHQHFSIRLALRLANK